MLTLTQLTHPPVLLDKVWEVVSGPVELDVGEELWRVAGDGLAPVLAANLLAPAQDELPDEPEGDAHWKGMTSHI